ncbi:MAG: serine protease, partial [Actinomycetota bacterium]|nr:serine protease [Actinomycetota bacterium]
MALDTARVVEVWAPGERSGMVGSGYFVRDGVVLTARHVAERATAGRCEVRPLGTEDWSPARITWQGPDERLDAALLEYDDADGAPSVELSPLGRVAGPGRAACEALGFPSAQARPTGERDTERLVGEIDPLSARKGGLLTVHIDGSVPTQDRSGHSPWEGMSGAALFSGPLLVGVVVVDPAHFDTDRLEAVPIEALAPETGFREALTGDPSRALALPAVEDVAAAEGVLREPYRPLPASRRSPSVLLRPEFGVVPFRGRADDLKRLRAWCAGEPGFAVSVLLGRGGAG